MASSGPEKRGMNSKKSVVSEHLWPAPDFQRYVHQELYEKHSSTIKLCG